MPSDDAASRVEPHSGADNSSDDTLFGLSFDSLNRAQQFLLAIKGLAEAHKLRLADAVMVVKDAHDRVRVRETIDLQVGRTALSGAIWASLLGWLIAGPVGWIVGLGVGAGVGAIAAKVTDRGVPDEWVTWFKQAAHAGTATVVVLAGNIDQRALSAEIDRFPGIRLVHTTVRVDALSQLRSVFSDRAPRA